MRAQTTTTAALSWWVGASPSGFTLLAAQQLNAPIRIGFDSIDDRVFVQRQHLLSAEYGWRHAVPTHGIQHANVVGRN